MGVFAKQCRGGKHEEEENKYKSGRGNILRIRRNLAKFSANATGLAERTFLKKKKNTYSGKRYTTFLILSSQLVLHFL